MANDLLDKLLSGNKEIQGIMEKWLQSMESESAEGFLDLLLKFMGFVFLIDFRGFKRNIEGFKGRYLFRSADDSITVSAVFDKDQMKVSKKVIKNTDIIITFRNGKALMDYLLSPKPDILGSMLRQDVTLNGNLNYLYKFAFMAKRLQLMATGAI